MMKKITTILLVLGVSLGGAHAQGAYTTDNQVEAEDVDRKLETAINVLGIIREELNEYEKEEAGKQPVKTVASQQASGKKMEEQISAWGRILSRVIGAWKKIREETGVTDEGADPGPDVTVDMSEKLGQTIEAMKAVRKELDRIDQEQRGSR